MLMRFHLVEAGDAKGVADARLLFEEYQVELGLDLCFQGFAEELASLPGKYAAPAGRLYVAYLADQPIACAALRPLDEPGVAEVKRMYVRPHHRGEGIARELLLLLIKAAETYGYARLRLDTLRRLEPAVRMYQAFGFTEIAPYNYNPEPDIVYMERPLHRPM
jgi:GNAT superfamily N-acetyltransferase